MPKRRKDIKDQIDKIAEQYDQGMNLRQLGYEYNVSASTIMHNFIEHGILRRVPGVQAKHYVFFDQIDTQEKAYVLGLLYADGCNTRYSICLKMIDKDIIYKVRHLMGNDLNVYEINNKGSNQTQYAINLNGKNLCNRLAKLGCHPRKSLTLTFPKWLKPPLIRHFIRGYMDGDGTIFITNTKQPRFELMSTMSFCAAIADILNDLFGLNIRSRRAENILDLWSVCKIVVAGLNVGIILDWLYTDSIIHMDRKFQKYQEVKELLDSKTRLASRRKLAANNARLQQVLAEEGDFN